MAKKRRDTFQQSPKASTARKPIGEQQSPKASTSSFIVSGVTMEMGAICPT